MNELITTERPIMTPEELEADKPKFNENDKEAKKLFQAVQDAYDNLILTRMSIGPKTTTEALKAADKADDVYTDLVTTVAEATHGMAPAFWTDPKTFDDLEMAGIPVRGKTFNQMAIIAGE